MFESLEFIQTAVARQRNKPFLKATMAASALAMLADGEVQLSERYRLDEILQRLEGLKIYDPQKAIAILDEYIHDLRSNEREAREILLGKLTRAGQDAESAAVIPNVVLAICASDGIFSEGEKARLRGDLRRPGREGGGLSGPHPANGWAVGAERLTPAFVSFRMPGFQVRETSRHEPSISSARRRGRGDRRGLRHRPGRLQTLCRDGPAGGAGRYRGRGPEGRRRGGNVAAGWRRKEKTPSSQSSPTSREDADIDALCAATYGRFGRCRHPDEQRGGPGLRRRQRAGSRTGGEPWTRTSGPRSPPSGPSCRG